MRDKGSVVSTNNDVVVLCIGGQTLTAAHTHPKRSKYLAKQLALLGFRTIHQLARPFAADPDPSYP